MRLVCPSCGAMHSAESFINDDAARKCMVYIAKSNIGEIILPYLALFRSEKGKGLRWSKALRLLEELEKLVSSEYVEWDRKKSYKNDISYWSEAINRVLAKPPRQLPLENHNYLRAIAWSVADEADRTMEAKKQVEYRPLWTQNPVISGKRDNQTEAEPEMVAKLIDKVLGRNRGGE